MSEFVPEGWKKDKLGGYIGIQGGNAFKSEAFSEFGIPVVRISNIKKDGSINLNNSIFANEDESLNRFKVQFGDILIAMSGATTGKVGRYKTNVFSYLNQRVGRFYSRDKNNVSMDYIHQITAKDSFVLSILIDAIGGAQPNISNQQIESIIALFPPLQEQKKIAAILTSVDDVIEKTQAQINKLKDLKTGMMQELLTRGVGVDGKPHTEFKDSPVGRIPKAWDCVQMDTICEKITDGEHQTPIRTNDGYYLLSARNVRDGYIDLANVDYVGEAEFQRISKRISPKQGDVLISCSGSVGRVAVVPPGLEFSMVRSVAILQLKSECVDSEFMALQVSATATQYQIEQSLSQQAQANLFQGAIKKLIIVVPSLLEQQQIANIVNSVTVKIITQQNKLKATKSLKKALMQDLLTGKVRVKVDTE